MALAEPPRTDEPHRIGDFRGLGPRPAAERDYLFALEAPPVQTVNKPHAVILSERQAPKVATMRLRLPPPHLYWLTKDIRETIGQGKSIRIACRCEVTQDFPERSTTLWVGQYQGRSLHQELLQVTNDC
jgi:hypothetical protein